MDELKSLYEQVTETMKQNEPDAEAVHCYVSEQENAEYVRDELKITDACITAGIAIVAHDEEIVWLGTAGEMAPGIPMRDDATLPLTSGNSVS